MEIKTMIRQLVKTLIDEPQNAGRHTVIWHGDDHNSNSVASGVYFYKLETDATSQIQRMVLMK